MQKKVIFGLKFRYFCFFAKFCYQKNSRLLIPNMTIVFLKFLSKSTQVKHFWSQVQAFSLFHEILQLDKCEGADFKDGNSFIKFLSKNTQVRYFWCQIQPFSFFHEILRLGRLEGVDLKYDNIVFKFQPKNTHHSHFWSQIQTFSSFHKILQ